MYRSEGEIQGGVGYSRDVFPSESYYYEQLDLAGNAISNYYGDKLSYKGPTPSTAFKEAPLTQIPYVDPYQPILNEPMGYGFNEKNFESSLDLASNYRYNPAPRLEEKYYPDSMLNDGRVDDQYERMTNLGSLAQAFSGAWWMPSYKELGLFLLLFVILMVVIIMVKNRTIGRLKKKNQKLKEELARYQGAASVKA